MATGVAVASRVRLEDLVIAHLVCAREQQNEMKKKHTALLRLYNRFMSPHTRTGTSVLCTYEYSVACHTIFLI